MHPLIEDTLRLAEHTRSETARMLRSIKSANDALARSEAHLRDLQAFLQAFEPHYRSS